MNIMENKEYKNTEHGHMEPDKCHYMAAVKTNFLGQMQRYPYSFL